MGFVAAKVTHPETRDLMAYGQIILQLARKHGSLGWLAYDTQFRQQAAAGSGAPWAELNPSLMAATVLSYSSDSSCKSCPLCLSADHGKQECALYSLEAGGPASKAPASASRFAPRPRPYISQEEICRRFNRGACSAVQCRYEHICFSCRKFGHGSHECRKNMSKPPAREPLGAQRESPGPQREAPGLMRRQGQL